MFSLCQKCFTITFNPLAQAFHCIIPLSGGANPFEINSLGSMQDIWLPYLGFPVSTMNLLGTHIFHQSPSSARYYILLTHGGMEGWVILPAVGLKLTTFCTRVRCATGWAILASKCQVSYVHLSTVTILQNTKYRPFIKGNTAGSNFVEFYAVSYNVISNNTVNSIVMSMVMSTVNGTVKKFWYTVNIWWMECTVRSMVKSTVKRFCRQITVKSSQEMVRRFLLQVFIHCEYLVGGMYSQEYGQEYDQACGQEYCL